MGILYLGKDERGEKIVIKEPKPTPDRDQFMLYVQKLRVEASILKNLSHEGIMRYIDSFTDSTTAYLVVEYIDGQTWEKLFEDSPLSVQEARSHIMEVLDAVSYMHNQNVIHRDIKPHNIMRGRRKKAKIIDFGGAKYFYTQLQAHQGTQVFTPGWAAPEQAWGFPTFQSDIYGVGATLFFLLTGKAPGDYMDASGRIKPPSEINPWSAELSDIVVKAMDPDPNRRYQTAEEMKKAILGKEIVQAQPYIIIGNETYPLGDEAIIGRNPDCDIFIQDPFGFLSRYHARIFRKGNKIFIEDNRSLNGTFIGRGNVFTRVYGAMELRDNDLIALCYHDALGPYVLLKFKMGG